MNFQDRLLCGMESKFIPLANCRRPRYRYDMVRRYCGGLLMLTGAVTSMAMNDLCPPIAFKTE
jgi:hypothetical protein